MIFGIIIIPMIFYCLIYIISSVNLHPLRNMSAFDNLNRFGFKIAFSTIIQKLNAYIGWIVIFALMIHKYYWYTPFLHFGLSMIIGKYIVSYLEEFGLFTYGNKKPENEIFIYSILALVSWCLILISMWPVNNTL